MKLLLIRFFAVLVLVCASFSPAAEPKPPAFDAEGVAQAETKMWQAYYSGDFMQIGAQLMTLMNRQYGLESERARDIGGLFAIASMSFRMAQGDYESAVLPGLTKAYEQLKQATGSAYDPAKAARAELDWWVARRTKGQNSAEQVGAKIADLYACLYGRPAPAFKKAGLLRAQAAALRDAGRQNADWTQIEKLLKESYSELRKASDGPMTRR